MTTPDDTTGPPAGAPTPFSLAAYPTRASAEQALADQGIVGAAAEELLRATTGARHAHRIRRYREGGLTEYARVTGHTAAAVVESCTADAAMHAISAIVLDAFGVGSIAPGQRHAHHRAFAHDCGPRSGGPSGAYASAAHAALLWLWGAAFGHVPADAIITLWPSESSEPDPYLIFFFSDGEGADEPCGQVALSVEPEPGADGLDAPPPLWLLAIAQEGMRRAAGIEPKVPIGLERDPHLRATSPAPLDRVRKFGGTAGEWSALVNAIERRRRVEEIVSRFARVVRELEERGEVAPGALPRVPEHGRKRVMLADLLAWVDATPVGEARAALKATMADDVAPVAVEAMLRAALAAAEGA